MKPHPRLARACDASQASELVQAVFEEFVAPDWEPQARAVFRSETSSERIAALIAEASFAAVAEGDGRVVGFILMPRPNLVSLLFVHRLWQRQGIARELWEGARQHIDATHPEVRTVELNASPYAVSAYRALGFYPISEPFRRDGCVATRMACWLPGKALQEAANAG